MVLGDIHAIDKLLLPATIATLLEIAHALMTETAQLINITATTTIVAAGGGKLTKERGDMYVAFSLTD